MRKQTALHQSLGIPVTRVGVMAASGCNFSGDVPVADVLDSVADGMAVASEAGIAIRDVTLADSMGWVTPGRVERLVGEVRSRWPDLTIVLHLHDTRGLGIARGLCRAEDGRRTF
jgi:hydroxymethylglutaryl-CoA lyase